MKYHSIQMRFLESEIIPGAEIVFQGKTYTLGQTTQQTLGRNDLPIGVVMNGYTSQFELLREGCKVGTAWFYFYGAFEGKQWAILNELELYDSAADDRAI